MVGRTLTAKGMAHIMNYRHIFHAGNGSDIVKHTVLTMLIAHMRDKEAGFCVLDTHAGIGLYDLREERALRTSEAREGIYKFLKAEAIRELNNYYHVLQKVNPGWTPEKAEKDFRFYPGSPLLAFHMLRAQDRLIACEYHEEDARTLKRLFFNAAHVHIHWRDGYEALQALMPPAEKRGLVLIDPPYEAPDEFDRLAQEMSHVYRRWPQGVFAIWYPIKERPAIWRFHAKLVASGIAQVLAAEFMFHDERRHDRLNGAGLILVNPPWQIEIKLGDLFAKLKDALHTNDHSATIKWLAPE
jgi:23S rRNA (adenine2030-N6)-methyltransferase